MDQRKHLCLVYGGLSTLLKIIAAELSDPPNRALHKQWERSSLTIPAAGFAFLPSKSERSRVRLPSPVSLVSFLRETVYASRRLFSWPNTIQVRGPRWHVLGRFLRPALASQESECCRAGFNIIDNRTTVRNHAKVSACVVPCPMRRNYCRERTKPTQGEHCTRN